MKITLQSRYGWMCLVIAALAVPTSGCKSAGFSMPGKNMFSWNRQPDAATLAGNTKVPSLPESPAAKYDPAAIASKSGASGKPAASAYGYGGAAAAQSGSGMAQPGGAAMANGYQSGPYPLASGTPAPATTTPSTSSTGPLPSPYGGSYNGSLAGLTTPSTSPSSGQVPLPSSVAAAMSKAAGAGAAAANSAVNGLPPLPGADTVGYASGSPAASTVPYQLPGGSAADQTPAQTASNIYTSQAHGTNAAGAMAGLPALPNGLPHTAAGSAGSAGSLPAAGSSPSSVYSAAAPAGAYSPGSTGRSTGYNFGSPQTSGTAPASSPPGGTQPLLRTP